MNSQAPPSPSAFRVRRCILAAAVFLAARPGLAAPGFRTFLDDLWPDARARGVSRATFDGALRDISPDPSVEKRAQGQSEFSRPISEYLAGAVTRDRVARGRQLAETWRATLEAVERRTGVPRSIILALWALESGFGAATGSSDTIRSLATLAFIRYRGTYFRDELLAALQILEGDPSLRGRLRGSWAGAMGQTQFMPTSYLKHAEDGDGDGHRDIWGSVPDSLASIGRFMRAEGWQPALPWGMEVVLPPSFDWSRHREPFPTWEALGVRAVDAARFPRSGTGVLFLPAGARGPAFLLSDNWEVIRRYNTSDAYALAVGTLADEIAGGRPLRGAWLKDGRHLDRTERLELQRRLQAMGLYEGEPDGRLGAKTRDAVRRFQLQRGLLADGYADEGLLRVLRSAP